MTNELMKTNQVEQMPVPTDNGRAIAEVRSSIAAAREWRRNENSAILSINETCKRKSLAEKAMYAYPRGGKLVTGPSIRLAEVIARAWGNISYGIREVSKTPLETTFEAYCHDLETNVKSSRIFSQKHERYTRNKGSQRLTDDRDIYELVANQATRRLRACILQVIPIDVVEDAIEQCETTLRTGAKTPIKDRIKKLIIAFNDYQINEEMIENRIGHKVSVINEIELIDLGKIYSSIRDGMSKREDWFTLIDKTGEELNEKFSGKKSSKKSIEV